MRIDLGTQVMGGILVWLGDIYYMAITGEIANYEAWEMNDRGWIVCILIPDI